MTDKPAGAAIAESVVESIDCQPGTAETDDSEVINDYGIDGVSDLLRRILQKRLSERHDPYPLTDDFLRRARKRTLRVIDELGPGDCYAYHHRVFRSFIERINVPVHCYQNHPFPEQSVNPDHPTGVARYGSNVPPDEFGIHLLKITPKVLVHEYGHIIQGCWNDHRYGHRDFSLPGVFPQDRRPNDHRSVFHCTVENWMDRRTDDSDTYRDFIAVLWTFRDFLLTYQTDDYANHCHQSIIPGVLYGWSKGFLSHRSACLVLLHAFSRSINNYWKQGRAFPSSHPAYEGFPYQFSTYRTDNHPMYSHPTQHFLKLLDRVQSESYDNDPFYRFVLPRYQMDGFRSAYSPPSRKITLNPLEYDPYDPDQPDGGH